MTVTKCFFAVKNFFFFSVRTPTYTASSFALPSKFSKFIFEKKVIEPNFGETFFKKSS